MTQETSQEPSQQASTDNPYVGPRTFAYEDRTLFFGRKREARDLLARVLSEQLLLFYAQSGAGKSSLLHTRLIPQLREDHGFVVLPVGRVSGELPEGVEEVDNIFVFNLMLSIDVGEDPGRLAHVKLCDFVTGLTPRTVVDDQGNERDGWEYNASHPPAEEGSGARRRALIVDQFEEIFTTHPDSWEERAGFFEQLDKALECDPDLWVVLTMREENVAALDPYVRLTYNRLRARFYMERMGEAAALEAIRKPAKARGRPFAPNAAEKLRDKLLVRQYVEPLQLQVVCHQLWKSLPALDAPGQGESDDSAMISEEMASKVDVNKALERFYKETLKAVLEEPAVQAANVSESDLRTWFQNELIIEPDDVRNKILRRREPPRTGSMPNVAVDALGERFMLHNEPRGRETWVELVHDRFVEPIRSNNADWFSKNLSVLQRAADAWRRGGRLDGLLLRGQDLKKAERWAKQPDNKLTQDEQVFLGKSQRARRILRLVVGVAVLVALLLILLVYLSSETAQARRQVAELQVTAAAADMYASEQLATAQGAVTSAAEAEGIKETAETRAAEAQAVKENADILAAEADGIRKTAEAKAAEAQTAKESAETRAAQAQEVRETADAAARAAEAAQETAEAKAAAVQITADVLATRIFTQTQLSHGYTLASEANNVVPHDPQLAVLLSLEALRRTSKETLPWMTSDVSYVVYRAMERSRPHVTCSGHFGRVENAAWSPDGRYIATAGADGTVRVWDAGTCQPIESDVQPHRGKVTYVEWNPEGTRLVSSSLDETAKVWDVTPDGRITLHKTLDASWQVNHAAWSLHDNGAYIATASRNGVVEVWDADTGDRVRSLPGNRYSIAHLAWNPVDNQLAIAGGLEMARIWVLGERDQVRYLRGHEREVLGVAWNSAGTRIGTASRDNTAIVWDAAQGTLDRRLIGHTEDVRFAAWSRDDTRIVTVSNDNQAKLWEAGEGRLVATFSGHNYNIHHAAWSPGDAYVVTVDGGGSVKIWDAEVGRPTDESEDVKTREPLDSLCCHTNAVNRVQWNEDGRIATASWDGTAKVWDWDATLAKNPLVFSGHNYSLIAATWDPDGMQIVTASNNDTIPKVWDVSTGEVISPLIGHSEPVNAASWSPYDGRILTASQDRTAKVWDAEKGTVIHDLTGHTALLYSAAWSWDGQRIVTTGQDRTVRVWDAEMGLLARTLGSNHHSYGVRYAAWSPDDTRIASCDDWGRVFVWDAESDSDEPICRLEGHAELVYRVAWNSEGTLVATASLDGTARVYSAEPPCLQRAAFQHSNDVVHVAWQKDSSLLLTASFDGTARICDAAKRAEDCRILDGHTGRVNYAAWSPDGTQIVTVGQDRTARVWDAATGQELVTFGLHDNEVTRAEWRPDGARIVTASNDGTARIVFVDLRDVWEFACRRVGSNLTVAEWRRYMGDAEYQETCPNPP